MSNINNLKTVFLSGPMRGIPREEGIAWRGKIKKILIILILVLFLKGSTVIDSFIEKHSWLRTVLRVIFFGGVIGWIIGLGSLLLP